MNKKMVDALNSLTVVDWSASCGELEYVLAANTEENRRVLLESGFTAEQLAEATDGLDENDIDLAYLAVNYAGVFCWIKTKGFVSEDEYDEWRKGRENA
ncbi:hypothetical protein PACILC2_00760 [Paenibacillus cisolokensis]|uniref:Phage protein n=1 Tax=Paenibacillus cisolokensis TaxID=1658519 RepID=A0ABQ4N010_9BACL|nr:hypothetical protein [Paenibacillus cisolokensis]GIQ61508.1 hypothetical protein PACILC2_00760 [Paenibacillus cisolokensis]